MLSWLAGGKCAVTFGLVCGGGFGMAGTDRWKTFRREQWGSSIPRFYHRFETGLLRKHDFLAHTGNIVACAAQILAGESIAGQAREGDRTEFRGTKAFPNLSLGTKEEKRR